VSGDENVTDEAAQPDPHAHDAHIKVLSGTPTDEELAAVLAVVAAAAGTPAEPREQEENLWGHPVDRLRYTTFSWQRVTLQERTHMRK
jgi:acyl-CoA carboxylase epsilon subunit